MMMLMILSFFAKHLKEFDPSIICYCAIDGKKVLEIFQNATLKKSQVILLDLNMPGMNGSECLKQLKDNEAFKHIPVIISSTSNHQKEADHVLDMGALRFFTKSTYFQELKDILLILAANVDGSLLEAVSHFKAIQSKQYLPAGIKIDTLRMICMLQPEKIFKTFSRLAP